MSPDPKVPTITTAEVHRLCEDKDVDISEMVDLLEVYPRNIAAGLKELFS